MNNSFFHVIVHVLPDTIGETKFVITKDKEKLQTLIEPLHDDLINTDTQQNIYDDDDSLENDKKYIYSSEYSYDWIDDSMSQKDFFQTCINPLIQHALQGNNLTIFIFGLKRKDIFSVSHGLLNEPSQFGMIPRIVLCLLKFIAKHRQLSQPIKLFGSSYAV